MNQSVCVIEKCTSPIHFKRLGYCSKHYNRYWKHGDPEYITRQEPGTPIDVKMKHFGWDVIEETGCWEWRGNLNHYGYGVFKHFGVSTRAYRVAYELNSGEPIPDGLSVCHKCDNRKCVNPDHLFLGTQADNVRDMHSKGRGRAYRKHKPEDIREAKRLYRNGDYNQAQLEEMFGFAGGTISRIMNRKIWKEIE